MIEGLDHPPSDLLGSFIDSLRQRSIDIDLRCASSGATMPRLGGSVQEERRANDGNYPRLPRGKTELSD